MLFALIICSLLASTVYAEIADITETDQVADNWLTYMTTLSGQWAGVDDALIVETQDILVNDTVVGRYYEISSGGFIIIPILKELAPIKVYSEDSRLDFTETDGPAEMIREKLITRMRIFADKYGTLEAIQSDNDPVFNPANREKWDAFVSTADKFEISSAQLDPGQIDEIGPLLTSNWHQRAPYNEYCPMGDGDRCLVGCVATAAAQIIWYHQWPPAGQGTYSYYWDGDWSCDGSTPGEQLTCDYSDPYDYDYSTHALAELNYEVAVAFEMMFGACASGTWLGYGLYAYPNLFLYENTVDETWRDMFSADDWFELIKTEINSYRPILYAIHRHAIVCDGWREVAGLKQYHYNYGWGGSSTGWYTLDELHCPWDGCDPMLERMVYGIQPATGMLRVIGHELTDVVLGDGDGRFENGETVDVAYSLANYGSQIVSNISIDFTTDDNSLTILNGSQTVPFVASWDTVDNSADPIQIQIPSDYSPRIDSFFMVITWNAGEKIDTIIIERMIGDVSVLLVDDDNGDNVDDYYTSCFENLRIPYHLWEADTSTPDSIDLAAYDIVFWFTGDYRSTPLDAAETAVLKSYMNGDGNLLLSGQGVAAQLDSDDPAFLNDYLKTDYQTTQLIPLLNGQSGGIIGFPTDTILIIGSGGAGNQTIPDHIQPYGGSTPEFGYLNLPDYGAVSYENAYRLLFFSFGFESIVNDDNRFTERDTIFSRILEFFAFEKPPGYPRALDLTVTPGPQMNMTDHTPDISWRYYDEAAAPQTTCQIQVSSTDDWMTVDMWDPGPVSGTDTSFTYAGAELTDGSQYTIRVRVHNGSFWSDWQKTQIRLNSAPQAPAIETPDNYQAVTDAYPALTHINALDGENDDVVYFYELYNDTDLTILVTQAENQPEGPGISTSWIVDVELTDDEDYCWRVRAFDGLDTGQWSSESWFWVNAVNALPSAFNLLTPEDGIDAVNKFPTFSWTASSDDDRIDSIMYTLYYTPDSTFTTSLTVRDLNTNSTTLTDSLLDGYVYFWRVKAYDTFGSGTFSSDTFTISTMSTMVGDVNGDEAINVGDAVFVINFVFKSGPSPNPLKTGDTNGDCSVNVGDAVYLINYVFKSGDLPLDNPSCVW
ncbi:MAG: hypothetical protein GY841_12010 [FCB group bacterium]|nr:hypothetical protein [FCB group bacterium]